MEQEVSPEGEGQDVPQTSPDEGHEPVGEGRGCAGASEQAPPRATVSLEPEAGAARSTADVETAAQQSAERPSVGADGEGQGAGVYGLGNCSGGDCGGGDVGGAGSTGEKDGSASSVSTVSTDPASPVAEKSPASSNTSPEEHSEAQQPTNRAAWADERRDCDGRECGDGAPASENVLPGAEARDQVGQAEAIEAVPQVANGGPQDHIEIGNDPDGVGTLGSSGSLAGCTTGETPGSADLRGDLGSAFGSECSEGNRNEEKHDDTATSTNSALKTLGSSDEPGTEGKEGPGGHAPVVDSSPTGPEDGKGAAESEVNSPEPGQGPPLQNGCVLVADENGHTMRTASGSTSDRGADELGGETAEAKEDEEVTARAPSAASQSPLNRLEEPPARVKPDRRHDVDGIDLYGCLDHFMAEEKLVAEDGNGYDCEGCSSRARPSEDDENDDGGVEVKPAAPRRQQNAKKRLLMLGQPPGVLVCHLKRLQAKRKIIRSVEFPIELDMAPYFWRDPNVRAYVP